MAHSYMPISLTMNQRKCLVVGGGTVAVRKVDTLLDYDAVVTVIAPTIDEKLRFHAEHNRITVEERPYQKGDVADFGLVIAASDDNTVNHQVFEDCRAAGVLVNVVDDPPHCDFIFPAVVRRECLTVAISTDGHAPFMAGHLKVILDGVFPSHWNELMRHAAEFRRMVQKRWAGNYARKQECYARFVGMDWKTLLKDRSPNHVEQALDDILEGREQAGGESETTE
ncbi:MAG: bifunctional precorrin-2 dehydrogenase/sirohydrochlorin ferrochelatase [candidate division Zixibacteria bacterium]|nr:bifunctional precorrin-2 dehydrogenase/sirohydrochlorin ferrochelatase [candidate division Zixibacteria bacterium]